MEDDLEKIKYTDHDLLIILHTKLSRVMLDVSNFGKEVIGQIKELQLMKHDKDAAMAIKLESDAVHRDHERRLRRLERWGFSAIAVLGFIELMLKAKG